MSSPVAKEGMEARFRQVVESMGIGHKPVILAISGGLDSAVLGWLCKGLFSNLRFAHCNFQLRGQESGRDEEFVKSLAGEWEVPLLVKRFETEAYARANGQSVQVAARELRYRWFHELAEQDDSYVLTAHHSDDNVETALMNYLRGTGMKGLAGIPEATGRIRRPLLHFSRWELENFAADKCLKWVEDSSNATGKYRRNFFRHALIPLIQEAIPDVKGNILQNIKRHKEAGIIYEQAIERFLAKALEKQGPGFKIAINQIKNSAAPHTFLYELGARFGFGTGAVPELIKLMDAVNGASISGTAFTILRNRKHLEIWPMEKTEENTVFSIEEGCGRLETLSGTFSLREQALDPGLTQIIINNKDPHTAWLDAGLVNWPIIIRRARTGDYFYPLGMKKKKKLSRFLIDAKLGPIQKKEVWLLESRLRVAWLVGHRTDDRFKIGPQTARVLKVVFKPA